MSSYMRAKDSQVVLFFRALRNGVFGTLTVLQKKKAPQRPFLVYLFSLIQFTQMLHFILAFPAGFIWPGGTIAQAASIVSFASPSSYFPAMKSNPSSFAVCFFISLIWVATFVILFFWSVFFFNRNSFPTVIPLHILRAMASLSTGVLFIPVVTFVLKGMVCGTSTNPNAPVLLYSECASPGYITIATLVSLFGPLYLALMALFTLVFYEGSPLSLSVEAQPHGRADFLLLLIRTTLVVFLDTFPTLFSAWVNVGICAVCSLAWILSALVLLPFYDATMNRLNIAYALAFVWSVCCLALSLVRPDVDVGIQLFMAMPLAGLAGLFLHDYQVMRLMRAKLDRLSSPYDVEIKTRFMVHEALYGHATDRLYSLLDSDLSEREPLVGGGATSPRRGSMIVSVGGGGGGGGGVGTAASSSKAMMDGDGAQSVGGGGFTYEGGGGGGGGGGAGSRGGMGAAVGDLEEDEASEFEAKVRGVFPREVLEEIRHLYKAAVHKFRSSSILHVFFSRFYASLVGNRHMQLSHLLQAERSMPSLDVSYVVYQARKAAEDSGGAQLSALARVEFDKYLVDSRKNVQMAAKRQLAFFAELVNPLPDLMRLHRLSSDMIQAVGDSEKTFTQLFAMDPQSVVSIRLYSGFNEYVLCNSEKAQLLASEADRIDEHRVKEHQGEVKGGVQAFMSSSVLDVTGEATAIISILSTPRHFGLIKSTNSAAAKLFGTLRLQLERRSVFSLFPPPLARFFESVLAHYVATGEGELSTTRMAYGVHRKGYTFPLLVCMREAPPTDAAPSFIIFCRPLSSPEQHIILKEDFTFAGASLSTCHLLRIDPASLPQLGLVSIHDVVEDWEESIGELRSHAGKLITIRPLRGVGGRGGGGGGGSDRERTLTSRGGGPSSDEEDGELYKYGGSGRGRVGSASTPKAASTRATPSTAMASPGGFLGGSASFKKGGPGIALGTAAPAAPAVSADDFLFPDNPPSPSSSDSVTGVADDKEEQPQQIAATAGDSEGGGSGEGEGEGGKGGAGDANPPPPPPIGPPSIMKRGSVTSSTLRAFATPTPPSATPAAAGAGVVSPPGLRGGGTATSAVKFNESSGGKEGGVGGGGGAALSPGSRGNGGGGGGGGAMNAGSGSKGGGDPLYFNDAASSHKSDTTSSSLRKNAQRLRRLLSAPGQPLLPGLAMLRILGILVSLLSIVLAVVVAQQTQSSFASYSKNLEYTMYAGHRISVLFNLLMALQSLVANAEGWLPLSPAQEAIMRAALLANATQMQALGNKAYNYILTTSESAVYTTPFIGMITWQSATGGPDGALRYVNLQDGVDLLVVQATFAAALNNTELADPWNPIVLSLFINYLSGGNIHEAMHGTVGSGYDISVKAADALLKNQNLVFYCMMGILCSITVGGYLPILFIVQRSKDSLMTSFATMPHLARLLIHHSVSRRYKRLQSIYHDEDDDEEQGELHEDIAMGGVAGGAGVGGVEGMYESFYIKDPETGETVEELDWVRVMAMAEAIRRKITKKTARQARKKLGASVAPSSTSSSSASSTSTLPELSVRYSYLPFFAILFRFTLPMVCLFAYYLALYYQSITVLSNVLVVQGALVASINRAACTRELLMNLQRNMVYSDRDFLGVRKSISDDTKSCVWWHNELLMYGPPPGEESRGSYADHLPTTESGNLPLFSPATNADIFSIQHSNACPYITTVSDAIGYPTVFPGSLAQCQSFASGLMTRGLAAAASEYTNRADVLMSKRMRTRLYYDPTRSSGAGVLLPIATYNYSADDGDWGGAATTESLQGGDAQGVPPYPLAAYIGDIDRESYWFTGSPPNGTLNYSMAGELGSPEMQWLVQADALFITPGFEWLTQLYFQQGQSLVVWLASFITIFTASFYSVFLTYTAFFYVPQIRTTNHDIVSKKSILLFIPYAVIQGAPALLKTVNSIFTEDEQNGAENSNVASMASIYASFDFAKMAAGTLGEEEDEEDEEEKAKEKEKGRRMEEQGAASHWRRDVDPQLVHHQSMQQPQPQQGQPRDIPASFGRPQQQQQPGLGSPYGQQQNPFPQQQQQQQQPYLQQQQQQPPMRMMQPPMQQQQQQQQPQFAQPQPPRGGPPVNTGGAMGGPGGQNLMRSPGRNYLGP